MNLAAMMKQAQEVQKKMQAMQDDLVNITEEGSAGAGMVVVSMNGKNEVLKITLSNDLMKPEEKEIAEDLIVAAINDAQRKIALRTSSAMDNVTGGLQLPPGFKLPF
jgi:nucleoid-associated protein EbfC